ncbi:MAG TPA: dolichyl-phosphate beta-glucosyltransferase [Nitrospirota bacterium]
MPLKLSVVIPAFNEEDRIGRTLCEVDSYLSKLGRSYEILVVDDGSTDRTREITLTLAEGSPAIRYISNDANRGKGFSVRHGFFESTGELFLISDADMSTPIDELPRFMEEMDKGADIVIGSRALKQSNIIKRQPIYRVLMGKTFNKIVRLFTVRGISDTQCGFKLFRRDTCEWIFRVQRVERFAFDAELLFLASVKGLSIEELAVRWINSPNSKVNPIWDSSRMLKDIIKVRLDFVRGKYTGL